MSIDAIMVLAVLLAVEFFNAKRIDRLVDRQRKTEDNVRRLNELVGLLKDQEAASEK
jgi:hypothetical protein